LTVAIDVAGAVELDGGFDQGGEPQDEEDEGPEEDDPRDEEAPGGEDEDHEEEEEGEGGGHDGECEEPASNVLATVTKFKGARTALSLRVDLPRNADLHLLLHSDKPCENPQIRRRSR
jgi:hypothetical protein